jgi:hypothetical protein
LGIYTREYKDAIIEIRGLLSALELKLMLELIPTSAKIVYAVMRGARSSAILSRSDWMWWCCAVTKGINVEDRFLFSRIFL